MGEWVWILHFLLILLNRGEQFGDGVLNNVSDFLFWLVPVLCLTQISAGFIRFGEWYCYLGIIDACDKITVKDNPIIFAAGSVYE